MIDGRQPLKEGDLKYEDDLKIEDNVKNDDDLKNEDDLENEDDLSLPLKILPEFFLSFLTVTATPKLMLNWK